MRHILTAMALSLAFTLGFPASAISEEWKRYGNARFEYWIDIPAKFSAVAESDNGDGGIARAELGNAELRVWGHHIPDGDFTREIKGRIEFAGGNGWKITHQRIGQDGATWSGMGDDQTFYQRAIPACGNAAAHFRIEYDSDAKERLDAIVDRLASSIRRSTTCRDGKKPGVPG